MAGKKFEMTGSPKPFFKTKEDFVQALKDFGWEHSKMTKKNNVCQVLFCEDKNSGSAKLNLAAVLGVEVITYEEIVDMFDLQGDI